MARQVAQPQHCCSSINYPACCPGNGAGQCCLAPSSGVETDRELCADVMVQMGWRHIPQRRAAVARAGGQRRPHGGWMPGCVRISFVSGISWPTMWLTAPASSAGTHGSACDGGGAPAGVDEQPRAAQEAGTLGLAQSRRLMSLVQGPRTVQSISCTFLHALLTSCTGCLQHCSAFEYLDFTSTFHFTMLSVCNNYLPMCAL